MSVNPRFAEKLLQKIGDTIKVEKLIYYQSYYSGRRDANMTSEKSNKIENPAIRLTAVFYIAVGIAQIGYFAIESFAAPLHIPALGILGLITAYSLFTMKKWTMPLVVALLFLGMTFGATTLSNSLALQTFGAAMLFHIALIAYMLVLLIASIYIATKRENFN